MTHFELQAWGVEESEKQYHQSVFRVNANDFYFWIYLKRLILRGDLTCFRLKSHPKSRPTAISLCKVKVSFVNRNKGNLRFTKENLQWDDILDGSSI